MFVRHYRLNLIFHECVLRKDTGTFPLHSVLKSPAWFFFWQKELLHFPIWHLIKKKKFILTASVSFRCLECSPLVSESKILSASLLICSSDLARKSVILMCPTHTRVLNNILKWVWCDECVNGGIDCVRAGLGYTHKTADGWRWTFKCFLLLISHYKICSAENMPTSQKNNDAYFVELKNKSCMD